MKSSSTFVLVPHFLPPLSGLNLSLSDSRTPSVLSICFLHDLSAFLTKRGYSCYGDNDGAISINEIELTSLHAGPHPSRWHIPQISSFRFCLLQVTVGALGLLKHQVAAVCAATKAEH